MPTIFIDPAYELEVLRHTLQRVSTLVSKSKAAGVRAVPLVVLEGCLSRGLQRGPTPRALKSGATDGEPDERERLPEV